MTSENANYPRLVASRWQVGEFLFVEFLKEEAILIDLGPFPQDPTDEETDQAFDYLQKCRLEYLSLGELEWAIDLVKLTEQFPALRSENLSGKIVHEAAFETENLPVAPRWFTGRYPKTQGCYYLRLSFDFQDVIKDPDKPADEPPPNWQPPKIIS